MSDAPTSAPERKLDFVRAVVEADLDSGKYTEVVTRFPPEPNGYLHIGHAKALYIDFSLPAEYGGRCHLRFDDTNPAKEDMKYVEAIQRDIKWLGFDWGEHLYFASDYFERLYAFAEELISKGKAYVCDLSLEELRAYRGTVTEAGRASPYRDRSPEENLALFRRMRAGDFPDGHCTLRAKIDMASPNMQLRDPTLYRIRRAHHYRRGNEWCIYPMYDFTHCLSDALEGITHSLCSLEFDNNRALYDWIVAAVDAPATPNQYEFARLNITYTMMSKRWFLKLVEEERVSGWDDPRMPTIAGMRRRGYTPASIRNFARGVGIAKSDNLVEIEQLEAAVRDDLNDKAPRVMAVLDPLKVVLTNYAGDDSESLEAANFPPDHPDDGMRTVPFGRELWIERSDFQEEPEAGFFRLAPGREVRLRHAYFIRCEEVVKADDGTITELRCTYDPATKGGNATDGRKVKGTIHWVGASGSVAAEVREYERLFLAERPGAETGNYFDDLNPASLTVRHARLEPALAGAAVGRQFQFERQGYFVVDPDTTEDRLVFNKVVGLRDSWAGKSKEEAAAERAAQKAAKAARRKSQSSARIIEAPADPALAGRFHHYTGTLGLSAEAAIQLAESVERSAWFDRLTSAHDDAGRAANWLIQVVLPALGENNLATAPVSPEELAKLLAMRADGRLNQALARKVFDAMWETGAEAAKVVEEQGLTQLSDTDELGGIIDRIMADNEDAVARYRGGKKGLMGFFVGQVMRATRGKANPKLVNQLLREKLG